MTDPTREPEHKQSSIPEPGPEAEPSLDQPSAPPPEVIDAPERSAEF